MPGQCPAVLLVPAEVHSCEWCHSACSSPAETLDNSTCMRDPSQDHKKKLPGWAPLILQNHEQIIRCHDLKALTFRTAYFLARENWHGKAAEKVWEQWFHWHRGTPKKSTDAWGLGQQDDSMRLDTRHWFPVSTVSQLLRVSLHKENILYPSELSFTLESFPDPPNPQTEVLRSHAWWVMFVFWMPIAWVKILDPWKSHTPKLISPFRKLMHHRTSSLEMTLSLRLKHVHAESQISESQIRIVIPKISLPDFIGRIHVS